MTDTTAPAGPRTWRERAAGFKHIGRLLAQVWRTSPPLLVASLLLRLVMALQPVTMLYVGKLIIDEVVRLMGLPAAAGGDLSTWWASGQLTPVVTYLGFELLLVVGRDGLQRATSVIDTILGEMHSNKMSVELMEHAARLDLIHFESAEYQDRLERARRQAGARNGLLAQMFNQAQDIITVASLVAGLLAFAPWLIVFLLVSLVPAIISEIRFNTIAYYINRGRSPERRQLEYLRNVGASAETAKEVKLFSLGPYIVERFRRMAEEIQLENRRLSVQRAVWGGLLTAISTIVYYGAYGWLVWLTVRGEFTLGDLTFLSGSFLRLHGLFQRILLMFTQIASQTMYLDDLFSFFDIRPAIMPPVEPKAFPRPLREGIAFHDVGFRYPDTEVWAVRHLNFNLKAGETLALVGENGAGKTTIVKLLTRLYDPDEGRITIDGIDLKDFALEDLRGHIGVIFQDFIRYGFTAAENIGVGQIERIEDRERIEGAAEQSLAADVIARLPLQYDQPLGKLFARGQDLSGGEWQKVAIARAYMRDSDIVILDEPTAALDARAEAEVFARFKSLASQKTAVIISHRFSTVRMADRILVLDRGTVLEHGTHEELIALGGRYAELFELQAAGYR